MHYLTAIPPGSQNTHAAWPTVLPSLSFAIITSGLGKSIHGVIIFVGSLYLWGRSIQEMGGDGVIGRSIYEVVVIDGSLYSRFYGIVTIKHEYVATTFTYILSVASWTSHHNVCFLLVDEDDLRDVKSAVADLAGRWKNLGISLGIRSSKLDTINSDDGLREMLALWLRQNYNVRTIIIIIFFIHYIKHTSFV